VLPLIAYARFLTRSKFARNVAIVASGTAGAQVIALAFTPIITRQYGPEAFGVLGAFVAMLAILTPLAALSYPIAIVLPSHDRDAFGIAKLALFLSLISGSVVTLAIYSFGDGLAKILNLDGLGVLIYLMPVALVFTTMGSIASQWVVRKKEFKIKAKATVYHALFEQLSKVIVGFFSPVAAVLVGVRSVSGIVKAGLIYVALRKKPHRVQEVTAEVKGKTMSALAGQYHDFPIYRTPQRIVSAISKNLPVVMLASFFGPAAAGFYTLGKMVMGVPSTLIGQSVASVFYPKINEVVLAGKKSQKLIARGTVALAVAGLVPFGAVLILGPWLFEIIFGSEWVKGGVYAQWMSLWLFFGLLKKPAEAAIPVLKLQGHFLIYEIVTIMARSLALAIGFFLFNNEMVAVAIFSIVSSVMAIILILKTYAEAAKVDKKSELEKQ
jgi:O-antigen/teichoic acid export membrane protein